MLFNFPLTDAGVLAMSGEPMADFGSGAETEQQGAVPDVDVPLLLADVLSGSATAYGEDGDPVLQAALEVLASP